VVRIVTDWSGRSGEGNSRWDDFPEHTAIWKRWWFRVTVAGAVIACMLAAVFLIEWI
jgi:hypothetical protein